VVRSYKRFEHFQEPSATTQWDFPLKRRSLLATRTFSNFISQPQRVANRVLDGGGYYYSPYAQSLRGANLPFQMPSRTLTKMTYLPRKKLRETFWEEFKRIYITEVIAFTMSKSTLFTLIFSFMFLGCIFFLIGFFVATSVHSGHQKADEVSSQHIPTETATMQGHPERMVNMGAGIAYAAPQAYQYQGGVKVEQNRRRPSSYVERQIATNQPNYR